MMATNEVPRGPTSAYVVENVKRLRADRRWSLSDLSDALTRMGRPILSSGLHRLETGRRRVDCDDLVGLAAAFDVSPVTLLLPFRAQGSVAVTTAIEVEALAAWDWMRALRPLQLPDEREEAAIAVVKFQGQAAPRGARAMGDQLAGIYERTERRAQRQTLDWDAYDARHPGPGEEGIDHGEYREAP